MEAMSKSAHCTNKYGLASRRIYAARGILKVLACDTIRRRSGEGEYAIAAQIYGSREQGRIYVASGPMS